MPLTESILRCRGCDSRIMKRGCRQHDFCHRCAAKRRCPVCNRVGENSGCCDECAFALDRHNQVISQEQSLPPTVDPTREKRISELERRAAAALRALKEGRIPESIFAEPRERSPGRSDGLRARTLRVLLEGGPR